MNTSTFFYFIITKNYYSYESDEYLRKGDNYIKINKRRRSLIRSFKNYFHDL